MVEVCCPVCGEALAQEPGRWYCGRGHSFDVARQGYVNLLPVSQKHSRQPGDTREQVAARKAFLDGGTYAPVAEALTRFAAAERPGAMLDIGCGEGYYLTQVQAALPELEAWGVDISKDAVRYAAVRNKRARFLTATAAHLPFADRQFDVVSSMFALTLPEEFRRVLRPGGAFIQVTAGEDHLLALRGLIYETVRRKQPEPDPVLPGFALERSELVEFSFDLEGSAAVMALLAMTPHYLRITKEGLARARAAEGLQDRAQARFRIYRRTENVL